MIERETVFTDAAFVPYILLALLLICWFSRSDLDPSKKVTLGMYSLLFSVILA